jgi:dTDP-4-dehydrorhamnose reductase
MRLLVTGASGLLGGRLAALLSGAYEVLGTIREGAAPPGVSPVTVDLRVGAALEEALDRAQPEAILHSAAIADPDRCERDPEEAFAVNVLASRAVARYCARRRLPLVALSTDLVFEGDAAPYAEDAAPRPILVYGRTKAQAEEEVLGAHPGAAVARVSLVVGLGHGPRRTATEQIARALGGGKRPRLYTDQMRTPIDDRSVAGAVGALLERRLSGRFHLGGARRMSRFEVGLAVARVLGLPESLLEGVESRAQPQTAPRPLDVTLESSVTRAALSWEPRPLEAAIAEGRRA